MENFLASLNHPDSVMFLISVLATFLIGFITAWLMWRTAAIRNEQEAQKWKKNYDDLQLEANSVREQLDLKTADLAKAERDAEYAIGQLSALQADKAKWQKDLDSSLEESVKLNASNHAYQATIEDLNYQIQGLKTHNDELALAAKSGASSDQVAALQAKVAALTAEAETLRAESKKEDDKVLDMLKAYNDSTNRLGALETKLGDLMAENEALRASLATIQGTAPDATATASLDALLDTPITNPADKEALTSGYAISPSDARDEVLAAIGKTIPVATAEQKNDLTEIKGIGSFLEKKLNALGIFTYEQVSHFNPNLIEKVTAAIEYFPGRIERDDWVGQAKRLAKPPKPKAAPKPKAPAAPDDLKVVEGIGPKIEKLLVEAGISTYKALSKASVDRLRNILQEAGDRYRMHDPSTWPEQARIAAGGDLGKLKSYQQFLSGGRIPDAEE